MEEQHALALLQNNLKIDISLPQFFIFVPTKEVSIQSKMIIISSWFQTTKLDNSIDFRLHFHVRIEFAKLQLFFDIAQ